MGTPLPTRRLGSTGPEITTVGFGAWAAGGGGWAFSWGPQDDDSSVAAIRHALSEGVNWIDTAAVYGYGHSEEVVAKALAGVPANERPLVFTKCGLNWDDQDRMAQPKRDSRPERIREECEASLRRLQAEVIDLYQFHWPDQTGTPVEDSWGTMLELVEEGKVRWVGVSNYDVALLERCEAVGHVESLQPPFSMIRRDVGASEIPWCAESGAGVIVYSPMQSGLLTDSFGVERVKAFAPDDWRRRFASKHGTSVAAVAVAWTLAWPGVTGAIVGARSPEQVDGWLGAAGLTLDEEDLQTIVAAIEKTGAGSGPAAPSEG
jgi:aryl-alcohol dehydrogenase-like predicted oxidoreductase